MFITCTPTRKRQDISNPPPNPIYPSCRQLHRERPLLSLNKNQRHDYYTSLIRGDAYGRQVNDDYDIIHGIVREAV